MTDNTRSASAIHNIHWLTQFLLHHRGKNARHGIGSPAGPPRNNELDRPFGIFCPQIRGHPCNQRRNSRECICDFLHGLPPDVFLSKTGLFSGLNLPIVQ